MSARSMNRTASNRTIAAGVAVLAGAALFEAALIPGVIIGGAAILAPRYLPKYLPQLRRGAQSLADGIHAVAGNLRSIADGAMQRDSGSTRSSTQAAGTAANARIHADETKDVVSAFGIKRAIAKTVTFRIIVTTLDFTTNYIVIGELTTAAGLSTFNLIAGPLFYLAHESWWNYFGPEGEAPVDLFALMRMRPANDVQTEPPTDSHTESGGLVVSRALAKTITFRTIATVMDFTTNYVVVRDVATAAGLSAFGFLVGPFIYLGHEKLWDRFSPSDHAIQPAGMLPAPPAPPPQS